MQHIWEDTTSYSRGEKGKTEPSVWSLKVGNAVITIICGHIYYPGMWIMNCRSLGITEKTIGPRPELTAEQAQALAIEFTIDRAKGVSRSALALVEDLK